MRLKDIKTPSDIKSLKLEEIPELAEEIREEIIKTVSKNGGHLASNLGVVELTIMLHYVFNSPKDKFVFDVGHQTYTHKLLTGRYSRFATIRKKDGLSGFPKRMESEHDIAETGHSSTSLSVGLGIEAARKHLGSNSHVVSIIGDGAMTNGLAFEGLNNISHIPNNLIVIVNNNEMSIGNNIGAISKTLNTKINEAGVQDLSAKIKDAISHLPFGEMANDLIKRAESSFRTFLTPGIMFREFGLKYFGPIDGHNIKELHNVLVKVKETEGPVLIQVNTVKGKGYSHAETNAERFHGTSAFDIETGKVHAKSGRTFSSVAGDACVEEAAFDKRIIAITAAMKSGTGLTKFAGEYPDRFFDVGIAEGHALSFASGAAINGLAPVVFIYSTFLQRAYDQVIHDIALMNLHVVIMMDRASLVPDDGETHQGIFDIAYLRIVPNLVIFAPTCEKDMRAMFKIAVGTKKPFIIRYPKSDIVETEERITTKNIVIGKAHIVREAKNNLILSYGNTVITVNSALEKSKTEATLINLLSLKPLDEELILGMAKKSKKIIIIEEAVQQGSVGSAVLELLSKNDLHIRVKIHGIPNEFIETASRNELLRKYKLDEDGIKEVIESYFN